MNLESEIKELLKPPIDTVERYSYVIKKIKEKMKSKAKNDRCGANMNFFYRGDRETAELCPKLFLDTSCLKVENITFLDRYKNR